MVRILPVIMSTLQIEAKVYASQMSRIQSKVIFLSGYLRLVIFRIRYRLGLGRRNSLRAMMRGYRVLKRSSKLSLIQDLHKELRETSPAINTQHYSPVIFGASQSVAELVVRQSLAKQEHLINERLLVALGQEGGAVALPLPICWLRGIESHGFRVAYFRSSIFLFARGLKQLVIGVAQIGVNLLSQFAFLSKKGCNEEPFVYFCDLVDTNLPQPIGNSNSYCIVNWYRQWQGRDKEIKNIGHGVMNYAGQWVGDTRLVYRRRPLPSLVGLVALTRYFFWAIKAIVISLFDLFRGRCWHAILLQEASLAALVRYGDNSSLARQYFFHNSRFYPPLWTYELHRAGSEVMLYWYSTNAEPFQRQDGSRPFITPYLLMNWPRHLVWDEVQADFVKRCVGRDPNIEVGGAIWFEDSGEPLVDLQSPLIAVFDVQPHRISRYCLLSLPSEFYVPSVINKFLRDIVNTASELKATVAWKRKRNIGKMVHPSFARCAELLASRPNVHIVDAGVSAIRVIERADIVISMPFTSTAVTARHLGKPSIYYDPSGLLVSDDKAARGIPIIQDQGALKDWVLSQLPA